MAKGENINEFEYSDSVDLGSGKHQQIITYNGKRSWLSYFKGEKMSLLR